MFGSLVKHRSPVSRRTTIYHFHPLITHSIYESAYFDKQKTTKKGYFEAKLTVFLAQTPTWTFFGDFFLGFTPLWDWIFCIPTGLMDYNSPYE
jgi:hypothetical protein